MKPGVYKCWHCENGEEHDDAFCFEVVVRPMRAFDMHTGEEFKVEFVPERKEEEK